MYTLKDLKPGVALTHGDNTSVITRITEDFVYYDFNHYTKEMCLPLNQFLGIINHDGWTIISKPLDQAFKELDKQLCRHKNTRKDIFFTAKVFITCVDCGQPLN